MLVCVDRFILCEIVFLICSNSCVWIGIQPSRIREGLGVGHWDQILTSKL